MATTIRLNDVDFEFDYEELAWMTESSRQADRQLAAMLTDLLDPAGPSGSEPNIGDWAISQVEEVFPRIEVMSRDETVSVPGEVY